MDIPPPPIYVVLLVPQALTRGSTVALHVTVPSSLGNLLAIKVWHEASGPGLSSSWFLDTITVRDMHSNVT